MIFQEIIQEMVVSGAKFKGKHVIKPCFHQSSTVLFTVAQFEAATVDLSYISSRVKWREVDTLRS